MPLRLPHEFVDNVKQKVSSASVNMLITATQLVDGASFRIMPTFDSAAGDTGTPYFVTGGGYHTNPPFRIWKGHCLFKTGATTLQVAGRANPAGAETLKFYINGVLRHTIAATIPTSWSAAITISGLGFVAEQALTLEIRVEGSTAIVTRFAGYYVYRAYIEPVAMAGWVAPTAFTTSFPASKFEAIKTSLEWLWARLNMIPFVPQLALLYQPGPYRDPILKPEMANWPIYFGSVLKCYAEGEILRVVMQWTNYTSIAERWKIYVNGVLSYTSTTRGPGTWTDSAAIAISHTIGTQVEVWIIAECITPGVDLPPASPIRASRYNMLACRTEHDATHYNYWVPPAAWVYGLKTQASMTTALNSMVTAINAIKARIDATPWIFGRWYLQRKFFGWDDTIHNKLNKRSMPRLVRRGARVVVYGKDVSLNYANFILPTETNKLIEEFTFGRSENVVPSDKIQRKSVYLDNYPDLFYGTHMYMLSPNDMITEEYLE